MDAALSRKPLALIVAALLLVTLLSGQVIADTLAPTGEAEDTGRTIGRAGFAYLTGIRTYAAAVLWNRLDPLMHEFYDGTTLDEQVYMLPSIRAIIALDPQFDQSYYVASWILARRGAVEEGIELARQGVENNPRSGLLLVNNAQVLFLFGDDTDEAVRLVVEATEPDIFWRNILEKHDSFAIVESILEVTGDVEGAARVGEEIARIDAEIDELGLEVEHDHSHEH